MKDILLQYKDNKSDKKIAPNNSAFSSKYNTKNPSVIGKSLHFFFRWVVSLWRACLKKHSKRARHIDDQSAEDVGKKLLKKGGKADMSLQGFLAELTAKKAQVESQDIEAYVQAKLAELAPKIRAEAEQSQAYEAKVLGIKIEAVKEAIEIVEAEKAAAVEAVDTSAVGGEI